MFCGLLLSANGAVANEVKQGGTLTVPIINTGFVENFNPYTTGSLFDGVLYEPLMMFNIKTGNVEYRLAESAEYSDDLKTVTVKLRKGLTWSDGKPLTAKDAVFSYTMTKDVPAFDSAAIWTSGILASITATDDRTIVFEFKSGGFDIYLGAS